MSVLSQLKSKTRPATTYVPHLRMHPPLPHILTNQLLSSSSLAMTLGKLQPVKVSIPSLDDDDDEEIPPPTQSKGKRKARPDEIADESDA